MTVHGSDVRPAVGQDQLVEVEGLEVHFPILSRGVLRRQIGTVRAVDGVSFHISRGETLGLVGESGCGKSTTGLAMLRLVEATGGSINFDGIDLVGLPHKDMQRVRRRLQMVFQDPYASLNPRLTVGKIVGEPLEVHEGMSRRERSERVSELLEVVGLDAGFITRFPHEFSGGQRQRIGIARALALNPDFVVCDEPISALDVSIQAQAINLLLDLQQQFGLTYLFIAHDLAVVKHISDRIAVMYLGQIVELANASDLYREPLHPYTEALMSAVPIPDPKAEQERWKRRQVLVGEVPSPSSPPSGCRFSSRCPLRDEALRTRGVDCSVEAPATTEASPDHWVACHLHS